MKSSTKLAQIINSNKPSNAGIKICTYDGTCFNIGKLQLDLDDVVKNASITTINCGDTFAVVRMSDEKYLILCKVVDINGNIT